MDQYQWININDKQKKQQTNTKTTKSVDNLRNIVVPYTQFSKLHKLG